MTNHDQKEKARQLFSKIFSTKILIEKLNKEKKAIESLGYVVTEYSMNTDGHHNQEVIRVNADATSVMLAITSKIAEYDSQIDADLNCINRMVLDE